MNELLIDRAYQTTKHVQMQCFDRGRVPSLPDETVRCTAADKNARGSRQPFGVGAAVTVLANHHVQGRCVRL